MGYGTEDQYRQIEKEDRSAFENYLRSPGSSEAYASKGKGLNDGDGSLIGYGNRQAQINAINTMNNIDWNSEEGKHRKKIIDEDTVYARAFANRKTDRATWEKVSKNKKGGAIKTKKK
jgi:hypothetical protein